LGGGETLGATRGGKSGRLVDIKQPIKLRGEHPIKNTQDGEGRAAGPSGAAGGAVETDVADDDVVCGDEGSVVRRGGGRPWRGKGAYRDHSNKTHENKREMGNKWATKIEQKSTRNSKRKKGDREKWRGCGTPWRGRGMGETSQNNKTEVAKRDSERDGSREKDLIAKNDWKMTEKRELENME